MNTRPNILNKYYEIINYKIFIEYINRNTPKEEDIWKLIQ